MTDDEMMETVANLLKKGYRVALCTLIDKRGSGPREPGAKMIVAENGQTYGSIGGRRLEELLKIEALKVLEKGKPKKVVFSLVNDEKNHAIKTGLICGGEVEFFIDVMEPKPRLVIVGAGHIAEALAKFASDVGFEVVVVDDNPEVASKERFPMAKEIMVGDFDDTLDKIDVKSRDFVVIAHGEPGHDYLALKKFMEKKPFYIGLLGSRTKIDSLMKRLKEEIGCERLEGLHAPIGLDIGAQTPQEIAISIIAEIIAKRRKI